MKKINQKYWEENGDMIRSNKKFLDSKSYQNKEFWDSQKHLKIYKKNFDVNKQVILNTNFILDKNMIMDFKGISYYPENELPKCQISINIYKQVKFISNLNYRHFGEKYIYGDFKPKKKKKKKIKYNKFYFIGCKKKEEAAKEILRLKKVLQELKNNLSKKKSNKFLNFFTFLKKLFIN